eukprot:3439736-Rhodomonas_salina.1
MRPAVWACRRSLSLTGSLTPVLRSWRWTDKSSRRHSQALIPPSLRTPARQHTCQAQLSSTSARLGVQTAPRKSRSRRIHRTMRQRGEKFWATCRACGPASLSGAQARMVTSAAHSAATPDNHTRQ